MTPHSPWSTIRCWSTFWLTRPCSSLSKMSRPTNTVSFMGALNTRMLPSSAAPMPASAAAAPPLTLTSTLSLALGPQGGSWSRSQRHSLPNLPTDTSSLSAPTSCINTCCPLRCCAPSMPAATAAQWPALQSGMARLLSCSPSSWTAPPASGSRSIAITRACCSSV